MAAIISRRPGRSLCQIDLFGVAGQSAKVWQSPNLIAMRYRSQENPLEGLF